jgi:hypothetical protein
MKKWLGAAAVALLCIPSARAGYCGPPYKVTAGFSINFNCNPQVSCQLGPWYHYWPLEAHFVTPAPCSYPYWPAPQTLPCVRPAPPPLPPAAAHAPPALPAPVATPAQPGPKLNGPELPLKPAYYQAPTFQPVGYYAYPQAPSYWYGR